MHIGEHVSFGQLDPTPVLTRPGLKRGRRKTTWYDFTKANLGPQRPMPRGMAWGFRDKWRGDIKSTMSGYEDAGVF